MFNIINKLLTKWQQKRINRNFEKGMNIKCYRLNKSKEEYEKFFEYNHIVIENFINEVKDYQLSYKLSNHLEIVTNDFNKTNILNELILFGDKNSIDSFILKNEEFLKS